MSSIKEVLRLKYLAQLSNRKIQTLGVASKSGVSNFTAAFEKSGLNIHQALAMDDSSLSVALFPEIGAYIKPKLSFKPAPDWNTIHNELKKKGVTRQLLWEEYREKHPNGYGYSQFNEHYRRFALTLNPSMRQIHFAGDKLFVDFSGLTMNIYNAKTGETDTAQIFVSVLGASGYTFIHAVLSQNTEDFIECHNKAFAFYGGVPNIVVPDNLKAAVISNKRGNVVLNESYADMARHYGVAIVPARPYHPQDKSKVELGVKGCQRWILAKLRHRQFFDIDELNSAIGELLDGYNAKVIRRLGKSRNELFTELDKPSLHPLRANTYLYREHKRCTVNMDYHIELYGNGYSVPYTYLKKQVDVWYSRRSVTISYQGDIIATHPRLHRSHEDSTMIEHMPKEHQYQQEKWSPHRILHWANQIGPYATALMETIMGERSHPTRGYKSCIAILSFSKTYGADALERICERTLAMNTHSVSAIESMLKRRLYLRAHEEALPVNNLFNSHENLRGSDNYQ